MTEPPHLHPASRSPLPLFILATALAGAICLGNDETVWGLVLFGWSLVAFALQVVAWLMQEHELWREGRGHGAE